MSVVEEVIQKVDKIEPMPFVVHEVLSLMGQRDVEASKIEDLVSKDPGMAAEILKMANSPLYNPHGNVKDLKQALVVLGNSVVLSIILTHYTSGEIKKDVPGYDVPAEEMWRHGICVAILSQKIAEKLNLEQGVAYAAGLLHDVGKTILGLYLQEQVKEIMKIVQESPKKERVSFLQAEKQVLGMDHAELGGRIAEKWGLPEEIVAAIRYHHEPANAPEHLLPIVAVVHTSNIFVLGTGIGTGSDGLAYKLDKKALEALGFTHKEGSELWTEFLVDIVEALKESEKELEGEGNKEVS